MRILGIESSCDETAISIIEVTGSQARPRVRILANVVSSQMKLHAKYGGVVPNLAKREHQRNFVPVLMAALRESGLSKRGARIHKSLPAGQAGKIIHLKSILERETELLKNMKKVLHAPIPEIDAIAVTIGPGLAPALWVGVNFARALAVLWGKPLIPVNHLEGHIYTNLLQEIRMNEQIPMTNFRFPVLCLIVSGGHTEIVLMKRYGAYRVIGETLDDAAGEAFDKVAKMLNLGFPGGPIISKLAERGNPKQFSFPRPMMNASNFDFSYSGLKTSVLYKIRDLKKIDVKIKRDIAASFESAAVEVLVTKTIRAVKKFKPKTFVIGGGVAANKKLRADLASALKKISPTLHSLFPQISLTGDNALMIALAGYFNQKKKKAWKNLQARPNLRLDGR